MRIPMKAQIINSLKDLNFAQVNMINLTKPISLSFYENWLDEGLNADMNYLKEHLNQKKDLVHFLPRAKSIIMVTLDYFDHPKPKKLSSMKMASYAKGEDYHFFFKQKLEDAVLRLQEIFPNETFKTSTDSKPILERDFAYQAGLGWFGKNTMLIHQTYGSYFLIGEIISTLDFVAELDSPTPRLMGPDSASEMTDVAYHPDRCGTCTKCIEACPTKALSPQKLDANKCISYWTIESKNVPPLSLAQKFESWFFGCDICQDVCPWNIKLHTLNQINKKNEFDREEALQEILDILKSSHKSLEKKYFGTPLSRSRGFGLKRNALIVAMNMKGVEIKEDLKKIDLKNVDLEQLKNSVLELI